MNCPVCRSPALVMTERQGIEIDYCPQCRGVWLDRGELDKIIERSAGGPSLENRDHRADDPAVRRRDHDDDDDDDYRDKYGRKKKRGLFGELFDFD